MAKKTHKYTMGSSVRTLSIKCYKEQLINGWDSTRENIISADKKEIIIVGICHDKDHNHDDIWGVAFDKPHYHIIVKILNGRQKSIGSILKLLGVEYRKGLDDNLWDNHGVETVRDFSAMLTYLTHETEQAMLDGKTIYPLEELYSNIDEIEIKHMRQGYAKITSNVGKYSLAELSALDEQAYALGYEMGNFDDWYSSQAFAIRAHSKMKTITESYNRGVKKRVEERTELVRLCVFIQGEPNTGKTYAAEVSLSSLRKLKVGGGGTGKFDLLKPYTEAIIIDDDTCPNLLNISDNYMTYVYKRNRDNPVWTGLYLIVTSNLSFDEWIKRCGLNDSNHLEAMRSRFYICHLRKIKGINQLYVDSSSRRGSNESQRKRRDMFEKFREKYDESLKEYCISSTEEVNYDNINEKFDIYEAECLAQMIKMCKEQANVQQ